MNNPTSVLLTLPFYDTHTHDLIMEIFNMFGEIVEMEERALGVVLTTISKSIRQHRYAPQIKQSLKGYDRYYYYQTGSKIIHSHRMQVFGTNRFTQECIQIFKIITDYCYVKVSNIAFVYHLLHSITQGIDAFERVYNAIDDMDHGVTIAVEDQYSFQLNQ
jgi:hypothetical protein